MLPSNGRSGEVAHPQRAELTQNLPDKIRRKTRRLSPSLKVWIVEQFTLRESTELIANELGLPVRIVTDVVLLSLRKPMGRDTGYGAERRRA